MNKTILIVDDDKAYVDARSSLPGSQGFNYILEYLALLITNSAARVEEMVDPEISTVIQHSASIDPGNIGGPLLIKDINDPIGYKVIGINNWKIENRSKNRRNYLKLLKFYL